MSEIEKGPGTVLLLNFKVYYENEADYIVVGKSQLIGDNELHPLEILTHLKLRISGGLLVI